MIRINILSTLTHKLMICVKIKPGSILQTTEKHDYKLSDLETLRLN